MQQYGFTLEPGEKVLRIIHRHWIDLLPSFTSAAFLAILAVGVVVIDTRFSSDIPFSHLMVLSLALAILAVGAMIFLVSIYVYNRNVLIFTSVHLIEVEQLGIVNRTISQVNFTRVQDVTATRDGILATILNYGNVEIQSAGREDKFLFRTAPNPEAIADASREAHEQSMRDQAAQGIPPVAV